MVVEKLEVIFYTAINITSLQSVLSPVQLQKTSSSFLTSFYSDKMRCVRGYYYGLCLIKKKQRPFDNLHINIGISISIGRVLFWYCRVLFEKKVTSTFICAWLFDISVTFRKLLFSSDFLFIPPELSIGVLEKGCSI